MDWFDLSFDLDFLFYCKINLFLIKITNSTTVMSFAAKLLTLAITQVSNKASTLLPIENIQKSGH